MAKPKKCLIQDALTKAGEIQNDLRALDGAMAEVVKGIADGNLRSQAADHRNTVIRIAERMENLIQTIALAGHEADAKAGE